MRGGAVAGAAAPAAAEPGRGRVRTVRVTTSTDLVLLLPGWGTPPGRLTPMSDALEGAGAVARVWSYVPQGAFPEVVEQCASVTDAMRRLHRPEDRLHLVGHSLGGIVAAATALRSDDGPIASVTTINSPWRGTWVSYTGTGPLAQALRWGSPTLAALRRDLADDLARDDGARWLLVAAAGDLATPATTALAGATGGARLSRRVVAATGHSVSLTSDRVIDVVRRHVLADTGSDAADDDPVDDPSGAAAGR